MVQTAFTPTEDNTLALQLAAEALGIKIPAAVRSVIPPPSEMMAMLDYIDIANFHGEKFETPGDLMQRAMAEFLVNFVRRQANVASQIAVEIENAGDTKTIAIRQIAFCGKWLRAMKQTPGYESRVVVIKNKPHVIVKGPEDPENYLDEMETKIGLLAEII